MNPESTTTVTLPPPNNAALIAAAKQEPGGWVYDIDYPYPDNQRVPPEAIRGAWESNAEGVLTGRYAPNQRYRPIQKRTPDLKPYMHAGARTNRNQWIVDIDPRGENFFPDIPEYFIRGWWYVDDKGVISNLFRPNAKWIDDEVAQASPNAEQVGPAAKRLAQSLAACMFEIRESVQTFGTKPGEQMQAATQQWENAVLSQLGYDLQAIQPCLQNPLDPANVQTLLRVASRDLALVKDLDIQTLNFAGPEHKQRIMSSVRETVQAAAELVQSIRQPAS